MTTSGKYETRVRHAATIQGLDPITAALRAANIPHKVAQTGGFVMVVEVLDDRTDAALIVTATATSRGGEGYTIGHYFDHTSGEDEGVILGENVPTYEAVRRIASWLYPTLSGYHHAALATIAAYDAEIRRNRTADWDTLALVAEDDLGEAIYEAEVTAVDHRLADSSDEFMAALQPVIDGYKLRLAAEIFPTTTTSEED